MPSDEVRLAILETLIAEMRRALDLQAREYERRLDDLNHAHQSAMEVQARYVTRELYEERHRELMRRMEKTEDEEITYRARKQSDDDVIHTRNSSRLDRIEGRDKGLGISWGVLLAAVPLAMAIGGFIAHLAA